jgi:hypothetical protein
MIEGFHTEDCRIAAEYAIAAFRQSLLRQSLIVSFQ